MSLNLKQRTIDNEQLNNNEQLKSLQTSLYKYCLSLTRSALDAEDLMQETFLKASAQGRSYREHANPQALLLRIAKNTWVDSLRRSATLDKVLQKEKERQETDQSQAEEDAGQKLEAAFYVMMRYLSPMQRTVLLLRDVLGYSAAECAECLETTEGAIKALLYRARQALIPARLRGADYYEEHALVEHGERELPDFRSFVEAYDRGDTAKLLQLLRWGEKDKQLVVKAVSPFHLQLQPLAKPTALPVNNRTPQMAASMAA